MATPVIQVIEDLFRQPPIPYEPSKHSLKAWASYCLRDRGFKVGYAERADFTVESKQHGNLYFNVTETPPADPDSPFGWIIWDASQNRAQIIAPAPLR